MEDLSAPGHGFQNMRSIFVVIGLVPIVGLGSYFAQLGPQPVSYLTASVERGDLEITVNANNR